MSNPHVQEVIGYLGANVRRLRIKVGLTQERLAETVGVELRTVQRIEAGQTNPTVGVLVLLADALEVPPGLLLRRAALPEVKRGRPKKARKD